MAETKEKSYYAEYITCMSALAFIRGYVRPIAEGNRTLETVRDQCTEALQKCGLEPSE